METFLKKATGCSNSIVGIFSWILLKFLQIFEHLFYRKVLSACFWDYFLCLTLFHLIYLNSLLYMGQGIQEWAK